MDDKLQQEIMRVEKIIQHVSQLMETPGVDLASAMRLNMHRAELIAYRSGIEYAAGAEGEFIPLRALGCSAGA
jgi:hypothetical protein